MRKLIEFLLSFIATVAWFIWTLLKWYYLMLKYTYQGVMKATKETYNLMDKGW